MASKGKLVIFVGYLTFLSTPVWADINRAIQAYKEFSLEYSKLPNGKCTSTSLQPYINALSKLTTFEAYSVDIKDKPNLHAQKYFLEDVIANNKTCHAVAGVSYRCDFGPCPSSSEDLYLETVALPSAYFGGNQDVSVNGWNVTRVNMNNSSSMSFRGNNYDKNWQEYNVEGRLIFSFEEYARDDWSVYLYDRSRDIYLQIDTFRMMTRYKAGSQQWQDLYTITEAIP